MALWSKTEAIRLKKQINTCIYLPFLREINVFLRQDGKDLVEDLIWFSLAGQSHVVLDLKEMHAWRVVV